MNLNKLIKKKKKRKSNNLLLNKLNIKLFKKRKNNILNSDLINSFKILKNKLINYYLVIIAFLIILFFLFLIGPTFKIQNIEIIKKDPITNMSIAYNAVKIYRGKSIFSLEKKSLLKQLKEYQQNIKQIDTKIMLPNTLKIVIESYKGAFNTKINNKSYIITENGTLIPSQFSKELKELIIVKKIEKNRFLDYKIILHEKHILEIQLLIKSLKENIINLNIDSISYYITEREIHLQTNNTILIFDIDKSTFSQIEKLTIFNKEYIPLNKKTLAYIDLRIEKKIFYCLSDLDTGGVLNEQQCRKNLQDIYSK